MNEWYFVVNGAQHGPVPTDTLKAQFASGELPRSTMVWKEGMGPWTPSHTFPEFQPTPPPPSKPPPPTPAMIAAAPVDVASASSVVCSSCKSPAVVAGHATPLCDPCRTKLIAFPVPMWIHAVAVAVIIAMLFAAIRIPRAALAYYRFERGVVAEERHDYPGAVAQYALVLASFPQSTDALIAQARAAHRAGNQPLAIACIDRLLATAKKSGEINKETTAVIREVEGEPSS